MTRSSPSTPPAAPPTAPPKPSTSSSRRSAASATSTATSPTTDADSSSAAASHGIPSPPAESEAASQTSLRRARYCLRRSRSCCAGAGRRCGPAGTDRGPSRTRQAGNALGASRGRVAEPDDHDHGEEDPEGTQDSSQHGRQHRDMRMMTAMIGQATQNESDGCPSRDSSFGRVALCRASRSRGGDFGRLAQCGRSGRGVDQHNRWHPRSGVQDVSLGANDEDRGCG